VITTIGTNPWLFVTQIPCNG